MAKEKEFDPNEVTKVTTTIEGSRYTITCWVGERKVAERVMVPRKDLHGTSWHQEEGGELPDLEDTSTHAAFRVVVDALDDFDSAVFDLALVLATNDDDGGEGDDEEEDEEGEDDDPDNGVDEGGGSS